MLVKRSVVYEILVVKVQYKSREILAWKRVPDRWTTKVAAAAINTLYQVSLR